MNEGEIRAVIRYQEKNWNLFGWPSWFVCQDSRRWTGVRNLLHYSGCCNIMGPACTNWTKQAQFFSGVLWSMDGLTKITSAVIIFFLNNGPDFFNSLLLLQKNYGQDCLTLFYLKDLNPIFTSRWVGQILSVLLIIKNIHFLTLLYYFRRAESNFYTLLGRSTYKSFVDNQKI